MTRAERVGGRGEAVAPGRWLLGLWACVGLVMVFWTWLVGASWLINAWGLVTCFSPQRPRRRRPRRWARWRASQPSMPRCFVRLGNLPLARTGREAAGDAMDVRRGISRPAARKPATCRAAIYAACGVPSWPGFKACSIFIYLRRGPRGSQGVPI